MDRRGFLRRAAPLGALALAGCSGTDATPTAGEDGTDTPAPTDSPTATPAPTPDADLVVEVAPGGSLSFGPETASVEPGATVAWLWRSGGHSVTVESQPDGAGWEGTGTTLHDAGYVHEHTFETAGTYDYYCAPHRGSGMVGSVTVGDGATATPTDTATDSPTPEPTATAEADTTVTVGPGGSLRFDPESFTVAAGETVRWEWDSAGHNVSPASQPDGASWSGLDESTYDAGTTHAYTFEVAGEYTYHCDPHQSSGMTGSFTVE